MTTDTQKVWDLLEEIPDPEIPVISIVDLGIIRNVLVLGGDKEVEVHITPTYSGCPATKVIQDSVVAQLQSNDYKVHVKTVLSPPWTTDWLSEKGRQRLKEYGIAPPAETTTNKRSLMGLPLVIECPHCGSQNTKVVNDFGSTPCKALYRCNDCLEPFDYFKCH